MMRSTLLTHTSENSLRASGGLRGRFAKCLGRSVLVLGSWSRQRHPQGGLGPTRSPPSSPRGRFRLRLLLLLRLVLVVVRLRGRFLLRGPGWSSKEDWQMKKERNPVGSVSAVVAGAVSSLGPASCSPRRPVKRRGGT